MGEQLALRYCGPGEKIGLSQLSATHAHKP